MTDGHAGDAPDRDSPAPPSRRRRRNWLGVALGAVLTVLLAAVLVNLYLTLTRTEAACSFYKDLAGLPVTIAAGTNRPSALGVGIIAHSREAYRGSGCTGALPPPSPSFVKWAPYYHLSPA